MSSPAAAGCASDRPLPLRHTRTPAGRRIGPPADRVGSRFVTPTREPPTPPVGLLPRDPLGDPDAANRLHVIHEAASDGGEQGAASGSEHLPLGQEPPPVTQARRDTRPAKADPWLSDRTAWFPAGR